MRFRFRIESSGLSNQNSLQSSFAGAKTMSRRFSLKNGASLPLALALGTTLCGGALLAGPVQAAPTVGSDENGPQVRIIAPSYQDVIKGSFRIAVAVTAKNYNPESIEMLVDDQSATDGPVSLSAFGNTNGPTSFDWDTRKFTDGPHKLTVRVTDKQGFRGWAEVNIFINNKRAVDTLPPSLDWQNIENYTSVSGRASIQLDAKDNFGVKMLMVTINPIDQPNKKPASATWLLNRPPYVVNFDSTRLNDGLYILKANAWDSMDQQGDAKEMTIGVLNNPVNARTQGEMMAGLRAFDTAVSNPKPEPRAVASLPTGVKPDTQTFIGSEKIDPNRNVTTPKVATPPQKTPLTSPQRQGALTTQTPNAEPVKAPTVAVNLTPSVPTFGVRSVPTAPVKTPVVNTVTPKPKPVVIAQAEPVESVAAPQLSSIGSKSEPVATLQLSPIESSVDSSSQAPRLAMMNPSDLAMRENTTLSTSPVEVDTPSLSRVVEIERSARVNAIETQITTKQSDVQARLSTPLIQTRFVEAARTVASVAKSVTTPKKVEVAAAPVADVEKAAQPSLTPRWKVPTLPIAQSPKATPVAKVDVERVGAATKPVTVAVAPSEKAAITEPIAQLSAPKTVAPKVSSAFGSVRGGVSKVKRTPLQSQKVEIAEQPVLAALPKAGKSVISPRHAAITVSPIEVSAGTMPSVHRVERTTTLRAIAARYGLPVELVAACNVWPVEMNVVKGMTVKLPRPLQVSYNGSPVDSDAQSMLVGDTAVAAFRFMFEKSGGTMSWDAKTQRVIAKKGETEISLTIGSKTAKVGDKEVMMELAAFLFEGRTMVPIRLFEEGLRAEIEWDPQTGRMVVAMINSTSPSAVMNG